MNGFVSPFFFGDVAKLADNDAAHCTLGSSECAPADLPEHIRMNRLGTIHRDPVTYEKSVDDGDRPCGRCC